MSDNGRSPLTPIDWHVPGPDGRQLVFGALREDVAHVRPGDEVRIAWREDGVERSCWARVTRPDAVVTGTQGGRWVWWPAVAGITTLGREVVAAHALVTDVRPELDEGVRQSWAERYGRSGT